MEGHKFIFSILSMRSRDLAAAILLLILIVPSTVFAGGWLNKTILVNPRMGYLSSTVGTLEYKSQSISDSLVNDLSVQTEANYPILFQPIGVDRAMDKLFPPQPKLMMYMLKQ